MTEPWPSISVNTIPTSLLRWQSKKQMFVKLLPKDSNRLTIAARPTVHTTFCTILPKFHFIGSNCYHLWIGHPLGACHIETALNAKGLQNVTAIFRHIQYPAFCHPEDLSPVGSRFHFWRKREGRQDPNDDSSPDWAWGWKGRQEREDCYDHSCCNRELSRRVGAGVNF